MEKRFLVNGYSFVIREKGIPITVLQITNAPLVTEVISQPQALRVSDLGQSYFQTLNVGIHAGAGGIGPPIVVLETTGIPLT